MGEDILTQIERGRRVGYSDSLIKKSLELDGYSPESIKLAFRQAEQRRNGNSVKYSITNVRIDNKNINRKNIGLSPSQGNGSGGLEKNITFTPEEVPVLKVPSANPKTGILLDILIGVAVFLVVGALMYLLLVPSLIKVV